MAEPGVEPTLRTHVAVLRRRRWWVAALSLLGLAVSIALSLTQQKMYSATAQLLVQSTGGINLTPGTGQNPVTSTDVQTELQLLTSARVQNQVRAKLGTVPPVSASEAGQANVIDVTAVSPVPARAALIANTYATAFVASSTATVISNLSAAENQLSGQIRAIGKEIRRLPYYSTTQIAALSNQQAVLKGQLAQLQVAGTAASTGLEFVTPAAAPALPSSPRPVPDALLGLAAGLLLGMGAAFLRDSLDDSLTSSDTIERAGGAPVLATVPLVPSWRKSDDPGVVTVTEPTSQAAEAYRTLRTSLQFARHGRELRTVLVTSANAEEGKTATVANLGAACAQAGARVVLVSCDLRRPRLDQVLGPDEPAELSAVLLGQQPLDRALTQVPGVDGLWTLSTRAVTSNPTELLGGQRMREVFAELAERFDLVLIDSPPVLPVADAMILTSYADGVLLVVAAGQTRRAEFHRTAEKLAQAKAQVVGVVLNKATARDGYYSGYGGYRSYACTADAPPGGIPASGIPASPNGKGRPPLSSGRRHQ